MVSIAGGVAVIHVGATTESELKEKKDRVDDALHATRAAIEEGIVPGGGTALAKVSAALDSHEETGDQSTGFAIVKAAISAPLKQLAKNAGKSGDVIFNSVENATDPNWGYNFATNEYADLLESGVVDPMKVTRSALQHACSVAGLMLTTEAMVVPIPEIDPFAMAQQ